MRPGELLLRYQHLEERATSLEDERSNLDLRLAHDDELSRLEVELESAHAARESAALQLRNMEREVAGHRSRMQSHQTQLMSGRIRNPGELTRMSAEVEHMKASLLAEEDAELEVMQIAEDAQQRVLELQGAVAQRRERLEAERPRLEGRRAAVDTEVAQLRAEMEATWAAVPPDYQAAYRRLSRVKSPVAEVLRGECGRCHVALTASELQQVRRGDHIVHCQSCSRLLVAV